MGNGDGLVLQIQMLIPNSRFRIPDYGFQESGFCTDRVAAEE